MKVSVTCQHCGNAFDVHPYRIGRAKFCSKRCQSFGRIQGPRRRRSDVGPASSRWKGGRRVNHGYVEAIGAGGRGRHQREHRIIAERALGKPLPAKAEVHHFDENRTNNANTNLVICQDGAYHSDLHRRRRVQLAGGDPHRDRLCCTCGPKPATEFYVGANGKFSGQCKPCARTGALERQRTARVS